MGKQTLYLLHKMQTGGIPARVKYNLYPVTEIITYTSSVDLPIIYMLVLLQYKLQIVVICFFLLCSNRDLILNSYF